jgi:hypothetical protein
MIEFYIKKKDDVIATGHFKDENWNSKTFILKKGSSVKPLANRLKNIYKGSWQKFQELLKDGSIKNNILTKDVEFNSTSDAGRLVIGMECQGPEMFKDINGKSINQYLEEKQIKQTFVNSTVIEKEVEDKKDVSLFSKDQIENTRIKIITKRVPKDDYLEAAYIAKGYEEILLTSATAINLNHTSLFVAEKLCNALPETVWDKDVWKRRFLSPFGDSGFLEKYIVNRLMHNEHMIKKFSDYGQRAFHILHNMIFGVSKTNAASYWLRKIVYFSADARIKGGDEYPAMFHGKLFTQGHDKGKLESYQKYGNIKSPYIPGVIGEDNIFNYPMLDWIKTGKDIKEYFALIFWDIFTEEDYFKIDEDRRNKIMEEIKKTIDGYFDVIIGNPPYNTNNEETGAVAETIYNHFCMAADKLNPKYTSFIIPSKWIYGKARIPNEFSQSILTSKNLSYLELMDGKTAFPSVSTGEILIYTKDNTKEYDKLKFVSYGDSHKKSLDEITYENKGKKWFKPIDSIIEKVQAKGMKSLAEDINILQYKSGIIYDYFKSDLLCAGVKTVGFKYDKEAIIQLPDGTKGKRIEAGYTLDYSLKQDTIYSLKTYIPDGPLWKKDKSGKYERPLTEDDKMISHIFINPNIVQDYCNNKYEHKSIVMPPRWDYDSKLLDYPYNAFIMKKDEIAPSMFIIGKSLSSDSEVDNLQKFIKTKFVTYLLYLNAVSHNFNPSCFAFVPYMDFTQEWDDAKLNTFFGLDEVETKRINDLFAEFRPMRKAQLQELQELEDEEVEEDSDEI